MSRAAKIYDLTLAANETQTLLVEGGFYKLLAASGNVEVSREGGSSLSPLLPGQGERENFKRLSIRDISGATNNVEILVADESFIDTRIYGNVQVIDGGRLLTMTDAAYVGAGSTNPVVGQYQHVQLWNPSGNTKWAAVSSVICTAYTSGQAFHLRPHNAALTTLGNTPQPKKLNTGFSNSSMQVRLEANAAILGGTIMGLVYGITRDAFPWTFKEPIVIPPGQGLMVVNATTNVDLACSFDFYEFTP